MAYLIQEFVEIRLESMLKFTDQIIKEKEVPQLIKIDISIDQEVVKEYIDGITDLFSSSAFADLSPMYKISSRIKKNLNLLENYRIDINVAYYRSFRIEIIKDSLKKLEEEIELNNNDILKEVKYLLSECINLIQSWNQIPLARTDFLLFSDFSYLSDNNTNNYHKIFSNIHNTIIGDLYYDIPITKMKQIDRFASSIIGLYDDWASIRKDAIRIIQTWWRACSYRDRGATYQKTLAEAEKK